VFLPARLVDWLLAKASRDTANRKPGRFLPERVRMVFPLNREPIDFLVSLPSKVVRQDG